MAHPKGDPGRSSSGRTPSPSRGGGGRNPAPVAYGGGQWNADQRAMANIIIKVGQQMGMSWRDIQIGLATAMTESRLRNLSYGDRDSAGLFQQRPSMGWGSYQQVTDPYYSSHKFFSSLKGVKNRNNMSLAQAAQAVQRSAYPDRYAQWAGAAMGFVSDARRGGTKITPSATPTVSPDGVDWGQVTSAMDAAGAQEDAQWVAQHGGGMGALAAPTSMGSTTGSAYTSPQDALAAAGVPGLGASEAGASYGPPGSPQDLFPPMANQPFNSPAEYTATTGGGAYGQKGVDNTRKGIAEFAQQWVGTPYVWGGNSLQNGVDCSGFVQQVYKHFGVNLPRVSYQQANYGQRAPLKALRPGDLVAWDNSSRNNGADHIAIYLGGGRIAEAPRPGIGVRVRKLGSNEGAWGVRMNV